MLRVLPSIDPRFGGPSESAPRSCIAAQRAGIETSVVVGIDRASEERIQPTLEALRSSGVNVHTVQIAFGSFGRNSGLFVGLNREIRSFRDHVDFVHLHSPWAASSIMTIALHNRPRFMMTPHEGFTTFDVARSRLRAIKWLLMRKYAKALSGVVFSSSLEAAESALRGPLSLVVPHAVVDETLVRSPRPLGGNLHRTFGYLGRLHPKKNIELCIRATAQLPGVRLIIAGDGPAAYRSALQRLAESSGASSRVEFVGFLAAAQKPFFFGGIDGLLLVSDFECFGMSAAEAMSQGVPVIVSRTTGVTDVVRAFECGFVTDRAVDAVADAMQRLLASPQLPIRERSYEAAIAEYSYGAHARRLTQAYQQCLAGP